MKRASILVVFCGAMVSLALAQQPASTEVPAAPPPPETAASGPVDVAPPGPTATTPVGTVVATPAGTVDTTPTESADTTTPGTLGKTPSVVANNQEARELPLDSETFDVRVHRRVTEYSQRHQRRERLMSSYDKVSVGTRGSSASPTHAKCKWS